jgi:hypothetical protein
MKVETTAINATINAPNTPNRQGLDASAPRYAHGNKPSAIDATADRRQRSG